MNYREYQEYLRSPHWQEVKERYRRSKLPQKCKVCGSISFLNLHHRTYNHLWKENISVHLYYLCKSCHEAIHFDDEGNKTPLTWYDLKKRFQKLRGNFLRAHPEEANREDKKKYRMIKLKLTIAKKKALKEKK
jgi:hypothetical protein